MSKWTDIRDGALEAMKQGALEVTEDAKQKFMDNFIESGVPIVEGLAEQFITTVKAQAANESGWCKLRDMFVIPLCVRILLWTGKQILQMVQSQTTAVAAS